MITLRSINSILQVCILAMLGICSLATISLSFDRMMPREGGDDEDNVVFATVNNADDKDALSLNNKCSVHEAWTVDFAISPLSSFSPPLQESWHYSLPDPTPTVALPRAVHW